MLQPPISSTANLSSVKKCIGLHFLNYVPLNDGSIKVKPAESSCAPRKI